jgi:hypothetical protein
MQIFKKKYIGNRHDLTNGKEYNVTLKHTGIYAYYGLTNDNNKKIEVFTDVFI